MKEKMKIIILLFIFIILLILVKSLLDYESKVILNQDLTNTQIDTPKEVAIDENAYNFNQSEENQIVEDDSVEDAVLEVTEENFEEVLKDNKKILIDFYADWCGPCQVLSPIVEEVAKSNKDIKVIKINIDKSDSIAMDYGVMYIPTLVVIENSEEVNRSVGLISQNEIEKLIK